MIAASRQLAIVAAVTFAAAPACAELAPLEPYQMVRSLQLLQDRIADGDHAALPMQRKLIELIDDRLLSTRPSDYEDKRNFRALLVYAMSGGNPRTVASIVTKLPLEGTDARISTGIIEYLRGQPGEAADALKDIDPRDIETEVAAFLALVKGSIVASEDPAQSLAYLDLARVIGPGTLVEEAALRRSIALAVSQHDAERFLRACEQYVRRFLASPYASQFADAFVDGTTDLGTIIDLESVSEIIGAMSQEQGKVIYLRLARRAAIDQLTDLLQFARSGLEKLAVEVGNEDDPRAVLYSTVATVTTEDVDAVRARLESIDSRRLSAGDRMLLDAAFQVLDEVSVLPDETIKPASIAPMAEPMMPMADAAPEAAASNETINAPSPELPQDGNESDAFIADTRSKIQSIDDMLQGPKE
ncbi:MAG: chemotaxis protein [Brucellaceae bacterium]|nr:chemotaxis protein [Brucellaceae bacterium]